MQWEQLTSEDFRQAVQSTGVCIIALGVLERHSDHLPLGTDYLNGHKVACLAAEIEPAVVFPPFYFGQIAEARCFPGAFTLEPKFLYELLENVLDEIARNRQRQTTRNDRAFMIDGSQHLQQPAVQTQGPSWTR